MIRPLNLRAVLLLLLGLSLGSAAPAQASDFNLPDFGEPADRSLPLFEERELGAEVFRQIQRFNLLLPDHELQAYVQALGERLVAASPAAQEHDFRFFVLRDPSINAFAMPGGYIGVHTGLIRAAQTEAELAAVLAHEIAHVTQRHIARRIDQTKGWDMASAALLLAALALGGADPDLVQAAIGIGMSAAYQNRVNYTRAHEREADRLGIITLANAGFDSSGMEEFFRRLNAQARLYGEGIPEILRTHPVSVSRMAEARGRRSNLPAGEPELTGAFGLMRVRAELVEYDLAQEKMSRFPESSAARDILTLYGQAMALRARGDGAGALRAARQAHAAASLKEERIITELELVRALQLDGQGAEANSILQTLHKAHPQRHAVTLALAESQLMRGQPEVMRQLLIESEAFSADVPDVFHLLARAAGDMNDPAEAQFQLANWRRARGDWAGAIRHLRTALRDREWDEYARGRLQGRLESLQARAPESALEELRRDPNGDGRGLTQGMAVRKAATHAH